MRPLGEHKAKPSKICTRMHLWLVEMASRNNRIELFVSYNTINVRSTSDGGRFLLHFERDLKRWLARVRIATSAKATGTLELVSSLKTATSFPRQKWYCQKGNVVMFYTRIVHQFRFNGRNVAFRRSRGCKDLVDCTRR